VFESTSTVLHFAFPVLHFSFSALWIAKRKSVVVKAMKNAKPGMQNAKSLSCIGIAGSGFAFLAGPRSGYGTDVNGQNGTR
jgi:hypothetical protein